MSANASNGKPHMEGYEPRFVEETGKWMFTANDGISYEYDEEKSAWFPMFDEQLVQAQQSAYGVEGVDENEPAKPILQQEQKKKRKVYTGIESEAEGERKKAKNTKSRPVTAVYVTGLPLDTTVEEVKDLFSKCGVIMEDVHTGQPKIKLYTDPETNQLKGDALVTYFKEESVPLAIRLFDDTAFRLGDQSTHIHVSEAVFKEKDKKGTSNGDGSGGSRPSTPGVQEKQRIKKKLNQMQRRLDWFEDEPGRKADRLSKIVILKNMYMPEELEADPTLLLELKEDVREECAKLGDVTNVTMYDKSPGGIISVRFREVESALACIKLNNGRFFAGRQISAELFDSKTKYLKSGAGEETEEEEKKRLENYAKWLEDQENLEAESEGRPGLPHREQEEAEDSKAFDVTPPRQEAES
ncbi:hypothetical protein BZG36_04606 [Bifiguratus adelaidae]|uniref:RRM domain-containing protein n=1 Tax=Bifiguratus adelaidae TaxID=1938954 RepID=A0A261XXW6_9FUNG|nr:hypothetical protein BZG36_04606 [Bifiguratus adelaidae]